MENAPNATLYKNALFAANTGQEPGMFALLHLYWVHSLERSKTSQQVSRVSSLVLGLRDPNKT